MDKLELKNIAVEQGLDFDGVIELVFDARQAKVEELQKRVDQQGLIIAKVMSIASDLQKSWVMFEIGKKLEQALKGDEKPVLDERLLRHGASLSCGIKPNKIPDLYGVVDFKPDLLMQEEGDQ